MYWFFIALFALFFWAIVNISDQYLVAKYATGERSSGGLILFSSFFGIFIACAIGCFLQTSVFEISLLNKLLLILTGAITLTWFIFYLFALEIGDVSSVVPWFLTVPIFGFALGYLFLGETLSVQQLIGSAIVLFGGLLISVNFSGEKKKIAFKPVIYMLIASCLAAVVGLVFKYVTVGNNFWISSFWEYVGLGFFGLLIYFFIPKLRHEFITMIQTGGAKIISLTLFIETFTIIGNMLTNYAILLAPIALVYTVGSIQPAILLALTLLATRFFPNIVKENLDKRVLLPKIGAIIIMIAGSVLLFV